jgi:hypothetical protein
VAFYYVTLLTYLLLNEQDLTTNQYCHVLVGTRDENDGFYFGWLDLLEFQLQVLLVNIDIALSLIYTIYITPLHTH